MITLGVVRPPLIAGTSRVRTMITPGSRSSMIGLPARSRVGT
jgi:hypothetical protein